MGESLSAELGESLSGTSWQCSWQFRTFEAAAAKSDSLPPPQIRPQRLSKCESSCVRLAVGMPSCNSAFLRDI